MTEPGQKSRSILCLMVDLADNALESFRRQHIHSPGRDVPLHVTMAYRFPAPEQLGETRLKHLVQAASSTAAFPLLGRPLSSFPTSRVLYLTPSPASPLEALLDELDDRFPELELTATGYPLFHLTLALGYREDERDGLIAEYFRCFGRDPLRLTASRLAVYIERNGVWSEGLSFALRQSTPPWPTEGGISQ